MIKRFSTLLLVVAMAVTAFAQQAQETVVTIGDVTTMAYKVTVKQDAGLVQDAMKSLFKEANLKTKNVDGYLAALDQICSDISESPINLYTKVDEEGKKKNKVTVITVCAYSNDLTNDQVRLQSNTCRYAESLVDYVNRYSNMQDLGDRQADLKKAQKELSSATAKLESINKDIQSTQEKVSQKEKKIENLKAEKQKKIEAYDKQINDNQKDIESLNSSIEKINKKKADAEQKVQEAQSKVNAAQGQVERAQQMVD
ncbi:MAG: hypothetical protein K6E93_03905 [Bacteroidales bacterium]|nr:hypothetical protein [Bacteroidales bacterium]